MSGCSTATFTITGTSYTLYWTVPTPLGESGTIDKGIETFDFWDGSFDTDDKGLNNNTLHLEGIMEICGDNEGVCFPICFPMCFSNAFATKVKKIWTMMKRNEEITISGLGDCIDAVYLIQSFKIGTIKGNNTSYTYVFILEKVRD